MMYRWLGQKSHERARNVLETHGRGPAKIIGVEVASIKRGDVFEPTPAECVAFRDLMEPVGESLRIAEADQGTPDL